MRFLCVKSCTTAFGDGRPPVYCEGGKFYDFGQVPSSPYLVSTEPQDVEEALELEVAAAEETLKRAKARKADFAKQKKAKDAGEPIEIEAEESEEEVVEEPEEPVAEEPAKPAPKKKAPKKASVKQG